MPLKSFTAGARKQRTREKKERRAAATKHKRPAGSDTSNLTYFRSKRGR